MTPDQTDVILDEYLAMNATDTNPERDAATDPNFAFKASPANVDEELAARVRAEVARSRESAQIHGSR